MKEVHSGFSVDEKSGAYFRIHQFSNLLIRRQKTDQVIKVGAVLNDFGKPHLSKGIAPFESSFHQCYVCSVLYTYFESYAIRFSLYNEGC